MRETTSYMPTCAPCTKKSQRGQHTTLAGFSCPPPGRVFKQRANDSTSSIPVYAGIREPKLSALFVPYLYLRWCSSRVAKHVTSSLIIAEDESLGKLLSEQSFQGGI